MNLMYVVKCFDVDKNPAFDDKDGHLINNKVYTNEADALVAAIARADELVANMIEADEEDVCYAEPRNWRAEYHDDGANVFDGEELAWRIEVTELTVVI